MAIQVFLGLLADALGLEKPREQLGPGRPSPPSRFVRERHEALWKRDADLHDDIIARCGIPGYSIRSSCIGGGIGLHWEAADEDMSVATLLQPEKFMRLAIAALQPPSRAPRKAKSKPRSRAARG
jgi:hypothetical protein